MTKNDIEIQVVDLFNGKVLTGADIPFFEGNLTEIIRQFSGQSYCLSRFTGVMDFEKNKLYEYDFVEVYEFSDHKLYFESNRVKIGEGQISFNQGSFSVTIINKNNGNPALYYLNDMQHDFRKIGDYFYNKAN